jgi:aspartyl-tRNA(Asn)/glutamyl-tRNA(Gln) amidotransferase subunit A
LGYIIQRSQAQWLIGQSLQKICACGWNAPKSDQGLKLNYLILGLIKLRAAECLVSRSFWQLLATVLASQTICSEYIQDEDRTIGNSRTSNTMEAELTRLDATELAELIRSRKVSSFDIVQAHLERIAAVDPKVNAIVTLNNNALEAAKAADAAVLSGEESLGPLHGVPFTVKDSIGTADVPTQRGSPIFQGRVPDVDAVSVKRMKDAGAILLAKTNLPEFSYSTESENLLSGRTNNPWDLSKTPGGSSGGESAAIAAGLSPMGLGTDLAISVRGPAAQTGIVALKATHGRVPMTGVWPRVPRRFWHVGPMARSISDLAVMYSVLAGPDGQDAFSTSASYLDLGLGRTPSRQVKIGWLVEPGFGPIDAEVRDTVHAAAKALQTVGCAVEAVRIPALEHEFALDVFLRLHVNEMKPAFAEATAGQPNEKIFKIAKAMLNTPETRMSDFIDAEQAADRIRDGFAGYFGQYDVLLCPVLPIPAHDHGVSNIMVAGQTLDALNVMAATVPFNVTGLPALSMRFGTSSEGLPINVQIVASWLAESTLLYVASLLETISPVKDLHPTI